MVKEDVSLNLLLDGIGGDKVREAAHEGGRELRDQHKITNDLENERKKQAILSLILAVIVIALGIAGVVAFFQ